MPVYLPGLNQQTAATLQIIRQAMGSSTSRGRKSAKRRKRTTTSKRKKPARRRAARGSRKLKRLIKGSKAAKAYMAKIRRKRK